MNYHAKFMKYLEIEMNLDDLRWYLNRPTEDDNLDSFQFVQSVRKLQDLIDKSLKPRSCVGYQQRTRLRVEPREVLNDDVEYTILTLTTTINDYLKKKCIYYRELCGCGCSEENLHGCHLCQPLYQLPILGQTILRYVRMEQSFPTMLCSPVMDDSLKKLIFYEDYNEMCGRLWGVKYHSFATRADELVYCRGYVRWFQEVGEVALELTDGIALTLEQIRRLKKVYQLVHDLFRKRMGKYRQIRKCGCEYYNNIGCDLCAPIQYLQAFIIGIFVKRSTIRNRIRRQRK